MVLRTNWIGKEILPPGINVGMQVFHHSMVDYPPLFRKMADLYLEARGMEAIDIFNLGDTTSLEIYKSYTDTMPPPAVEYKYPDRNWKRVWRRQNDPILGTGGQSLLDLILHERVGTRERGNKIMVTRYPDGRCPRCWTDTENGQ